MLELGTDDTRVTMRASDTTPNNGDVGSINLGLAGLDESNALTEVEVGFFLCGNTLNADERGVFVLVALTALEAKEAALRVKTILY